MKNLVKKLLSVFSIKVTIENEKHHLLKLGLDNNNYKLVDNGQRLLLTDFSLLIDPLKHDYILKSISYLYDLKEKQNAQFEFDENERLIVKIGSLAYNIQTYEEFFILNEVFIHGVYNIETPGKFALIDIGMNVAITSLYFAGNADCLSIYSFEPFKLTFEQALFNMSLNPGIKNKINPANFGLGDTARQITVPYDKIIKGNMGINGIPSHSMRANQEILNDEIEIRNAAETLLPIIKLIKETTDTIVLKVDCEGAEYEIFESFAASDLLSSFNAIIIEWHAKGPEPILTYLKESGFTIFAFDPASKSAGMIYAFKK